MNNYDMQDKQLSRRDFHYLVVWKDMQSFSGMHGMNEVKPTFSFDDDSELNDWHLTMNTIWGNTINLTIDCGFDSLWKIFDMWQTGALR